jgi:hypothetical protein
MVSTSWFDNDTKSRFQMQEERRAEKALQHVLYRETELKHESGLETNALINKRLFQEMGVSQKEEKSNCICIHRHSYFT